MCSCVRQKLWVTWGLLLAIGMWSGESLVGMSPLPVGSDPTAVWIKPEFNCTIGHPKEVAENWWWCGTPYLKHQCWNRGQHPLILYQIGLTLLTDNEKEREIERENTL